MTGNTVFVPWVCAQSLKLYLWLSTCGDSKLILGSFILMARPNLPYRRKSLQLVGVSRVWKRRKLEVCVSSSSLFPYIIRISPWSQLLSCSRKMIHHCHPRQPVWTVAITVRSGPRELFFKDSSPSAATTTALHQFLLSLTQYFPLPTHHHPRSCSSWSSSHPLPLQRTSTSHCDVTRGTDIVNTFCLQVKFGKSIPFYDKNQSLSGIISLLWQSDLQAQQSLDSFYESQRPTL